MNNSVELIGYYGDDKIHACSAWTSTSRDLSNEKINRIPNLLKMLATEGHHTPFEKIVFTFSGNNRHCLPYSYNQTSYRRKCEW